MDVQSNNNNNNIAVRQLQKLKVLLKKYREIRIMQTGLLRLSELAGTISDIGSFYQALDGVINSLLTTNNFHIALVDEQQKLFLAYIHNEHGASVLKQKKGGPCLDSITALVFNERRALHCSSADKLALIQAKKISEHDTACVDWLGVPLKRGKQVIGVIALQSYDQKLYFDAQDCKLLEFIAEHIVTAIDRVHSRELLETSITERTVKLTKANQRLQKEIVERQKAEQLHKALLVISEITALNLDLSSFYQALHEQVKLLMPADNFYIAQYNNSAELECSYFADQKLSIISPENLNNPLLQQTMRTGSPVLLLDDRHFTLDEQGQIISCRPLTYSNRLSKAWLSAPLSDEGEVFGILVVQDYVNQDAYKVVDLKLIKFFAQHIATAIIRKRVQVQELKNKDALELIVKQRTQALEVANLHLRMQIEERKKAEEKLYHEAHHDALTNLPNRAMFATRLAYALTHVKRHPNHKFAVLFIDLDRFKMINDTLGHQAGDEFLVEISKRLSECVRGNDLLARLGGDEFVVLLDAFNSQDDVEDIASRIIERISEPFTLSATQLYSNASIGIAMFNSTYQNADEVLRDADAAMYQAKSLGRGRYVFFDESMREQLLANLTLEQELRIAIREQQFELHYQTISNLDKDNVIGFEALLRWNHPTKGLLTPSQFLYMAEETGMILEIESWVIEEVSLQLSHWQNSKLYKNAFIGINLSGRHLTQANQLKKLMALITKNTDEVHRIILEFNEKAFAQHTDLALKGLRQLKAFGVKLALDDYGAGLSSLNFLHNYPFEFIKLDRSFIKTLNSNNNNFALVKALTDLGHKYGYHLVAEGIESEEMLQKLNAVGCEFGQGYHISRPSKFSRADVHFITAKKA